MNNDISLLGFVTAGARTIEDGKRYENLFPIADGGRTLLNNNGSVEDTVFLMGDFIKKFKSDTANLAPLLKGNSLRENCGNVWSFLYNNIQYKLDTPGEEQLRRPARLWADRHTGGDCDCMSIFVGTILLNLGIRFKIRIARYEGKQGFQHVYIIVPVDTFNYYTIDGVVSQFDYEKPYAQIKDYTMEQLGIPIIGLSGIDDMLMEGVGATPLEKDVYQHLLQTRQYIKDHPGAISMIDHEPGFLKMLDYAIDNFNTANRDKAFEILARYEAEINKLNGIEDDDLLGVHEDDDYLGGLTDQDDFEGIDEDDVYGFDGLGRAKRSKSERKQQRKEKRTAKKAERKENKAKNKQERKKAKGFFRKVGVALKQGGKKFIKLNPAVIAMRNSFLLAMKINLFNIASKLKWGYATPEEAKKAGISDDQYNRSKKAVAQVEKLFSQKAGGSKVSLRKNILNSKKAQINGLGDLGVAQAAIATAIPMITAVLKMLKDNGLLSKKQADDIEAKVDSGELPSTDAKDLEAIANEEAVSDSAEESASSSSSSGASSTTESAPEAAQDDNSSQNGADDKKDFLKTITDFAKEHPIFITGIALAGAYAFIPPLRNSVNSMLGIGKEKTPEKSLSGCHKNTLEGIGRKPKARHKEVQEIKLK